MHLVASEGLEAYLPLAAMVDISAEVQRLQKRLVKMEQEYKGLKARLSSPEVGFLLIIIFLKLFFLFRSRLVLFVQNLCFPRVCLYALVLKSRISIILVNLDESG